LQCLLDLLLIPTRNPTLRVLPQALQRVVDEAIAGEGIFDKGVVGVERFSLGLDVCSIDADDSVQRRTRNFILNPCCLQRVPAPRAPAYDFSAA